MTNKPTFNFITTGNKSAGSTRIRVYKICDFLRSKGYVAEINSKKNADVYIFQKSDPRKLKKLFLKYKVLNKFIAFDIDDYHPFNYNYIIKNSDIVIVNVQRLKDDYSNLNKNIVVIPNSLDVKDENSPLLAYNLKNPVLGWFGNSTNLPALREINVNNVTTITNRGCGDIEWKLDTIDKELQKFDLILIPQDRTRSGCAKCNCRMLKALYLGRPVLVDDLPPYVEFAKEIGYPESFIVPHGSDWNIYLNKICTGEIELNFDMESGRKRIRELYGLQHIGQLWLESVMNSFFNKKKATNYTQIFNYIFRHILDIQQFDNCTIIYIFDIIRIKIKKKETK